MKKKYTKLTLDEFNEIARKVLSSNHKPTENEMVAWEDAVEVLSEIAKQSDLVDR